MDKNDLKSVLSSALNLVRTFIDWLKKRLKLSSAKTELVAAQMEEEKKQIDRANLWTDYNKVVHTLLKE